MRYLHNILFLVILICFSACRKVFDEDIYAENYGIELYAGAGPNLVVKGTEPYQFKEGTLFHIYGTRPGSGSDVPDNWDVNYMTDKSVTSAGVVRGMATTDLDGTKRKIVSKEGETGISSVFRTEPMNLYGVTVVCIDNHAIEEDEDQIAHHNAQLEQFLTEGDPVDNIPHYKVSYSDRTQQMPDVMWSTVKGLTPKNNSGKLAMPFKHTMTKLNFVAVQGADLDPTIEKMEIKSLVVKDYHDGILHMENGLYTHTAPADRREWMTSPSISFNDNEEVEVMKGQENPFGSCIIFPTNGANYDDPFGGESNTAVIDDKDAVYVRLTVLLTRKDDQGNIKPEKETLVFDKVKLTHYERPAVFHPNCEYVITFSLTTSQTIVTLRPEYYEYIEEYVPLSPNDVGEPTDFGGVLWATSNLGATSANPTLNAYEWEKSRGFYYQFGRNIPYYVRGSVLDPFPYAASYIDKPSGSGNDYLWDYENESFLYTEQDGDYDVHIPYGNTVYDLNKNHGARAYPYIPALWEREIDNIRANPTKADSIKGYTNFLREARFYSPKISNGQSAPAKNQSDPYEFVNTAANRVEQFAFSAYYESAYVRTWKKEKTQPLNWSDAYNNPSGPCPKGWRLPSSAEFLSIFPSSDEAGDIAFNPKNSNHTAPHEVKGDKTKQVETFTCTVANDYMGETAFYVGILQDGLGNNRIKDDMMGIIQGWGTIYAIKRQGTEDAYGIRWQIKVADYDEKNNAAEAGVNASIADFKNVAKIGRGVLVISKYDLESKYGKSKISLKAVRNKVNNVDVAYKAQSKVPQYLCKGVVKDGTKDVTFDIDWDNPSGQLYLPIPGYVIVPSSGGQALIYPGTEALYWTSTLTSKMAGVAVRIKYAGDAGSRYVTIASGESVANGANVRCVRDTKAEN